MPPGGGVTVVAVGVALLSMVVAVVGVLLPSEIVGVNITELSVVCIVHIRIFA